MAVLTNGHQAPGSGGGVMGGRWKGPDRVPNGPLREAFLSSHLTASEVCAAMGWYRDRPGTKPRTNHVDTTRLMRTLGLHTSMKDGSRGWYHTLSEERARALCRVLGADFDELYADHLPAQAAAGVCGCGNPMLWPAPRCVMCEAEAELGMAA